ncbi:F-box/WD-40 repeat-containing protein At3g52030-like [Phragmites australis]|uniref:F-box/WD-40 repeat-containing protein At3g52030-like n=1 Tax=Phragmites australis TaxID=29695 RepID=UPI002D76677D|nr:F-box/WD-40 repeat-containing protein At3g52030-like [Phragmites australis]
MEASSSRSQSGSGSANLKRRRGVSASAGSGSMAQSLNDDILRSAFSRLDDHFDLARCSAVCNSWSGAPPHTSHLSPFSPQLFYCLLELAADYACEVALYIVGLTSSQLCIWRRSEPRSIFQSGGASFNHGLCMSYADPEVVIGCEDGRAFVYDMYSRSCSSIYQLHSSPVTCLTITDDQLIVGGSTFGNVAIADQTSGQKLGVLKSAFAPLGKHSTFRLIANHKHGQLPFVDDRLVLELLIGENSACCKVGAMVEAQGSPMLKSEFCSHAAPWRDEAVPEMVDELHSPCFDVDVGGLESKETMVVGGEAAEDALMIDSVVAGGGMKKASIEAAQLPCCRSSLLVQASEAGGSTTIRSMVVDADRPAESTSRSRQQIEKKRVRQVAPDARLDNIPRRLRPQITSLSLGMKKIVTTHGENYIRVWKFRPKSL